MNFWKAEDVADFHTMAAHVKAGPSPCLHSGSPVSANVSAEDDEVDGDPTRLR
jgi:hypothetical protein